jgi:hypothetical protein
VGWAYRDGLVGAVDAGRDNGHGWELGRGADAHDPDIQRQENENYPRKPPVVVGPEGAAAVALAWPGLRRRCFSPGVSFG